MYGRYQRSVSNDPTSRMFAFCCIDQRQDMSVLSAHKTRVTRRQSSSKAAKTVKQLVLEFLGPFFQRLCPEMLRIDLFIEFRLSQELEEVAQADHVDAVSRERPVDMIATRLFNFTNGIR